MMDGVDCYSEEFGCVTYSDGDRGLGFYNQSGYMIRLRTLLDCDDTWKIAEYEYKFVYRNSDNKFTLSEFFYTNVEEFRKHLTDGGHDPGDDVELIQISKRMKKC